MRGDDTKYTRKILVYSLGGRKKEGQRKAVRDRRKKKIKSLVLNLVYRLPAGDLSLPVTVIK